jgi:hypothetical protein
MERDLLMGETSLAERLGRKPEERLLIINCDDAGSSHAANVAIHRSVVYGVATSATLMVPCPWAYAAARRLHGWPTGVHLTLTSEHRDYRWRALTGGASLRDADGFLHSTSRAALDRLDPEDARIECRAQIQVALSWGVDVTHLDAHMNVMQARDDLSEVYFALAAEFRLPVRMLPPHIANRGAGPGGWIGRVLGRKPARLDPGRFHFYEHTPPAPSGGLREDFARVVLRFADGTFTQPDWQHYPVIPQAIQSARFDCAQDIVHMNGVDRVAIP